MKIITVEASRKYHIMIERGLLSDCGNIVSGLVKKPCRIMLVSDTNVYPLYGEKVVASLTNKGFDVNTYIFPAGESSKNVTTLAGLWEELAEKHFTRSDMIVALGGGVVGDLAGFAASTFLRSIQYIQIPTSLLAMVDSSVGGKTAIDLKGGKNLAGSFYQPSAVICDPDTLQTLPREIYSDGMAEVIKYGMINKPELLQILKGTYDDADVIEICVCAKRDIVNEDEKDLGVRQFLNFGHTLAHGIERASDYKIPHGRAVAVGMVLITKAAIKAGLCTEDALQILEELLVKNNLPLWTDITAQELCDAALNDKKRKGDYITVVLPTGVGKSTLQKISISQLNELIKGVWTE